MDQNTREARPCLPLALSLAGAGRRGTGMTMSLESSRTESGVRFSGVVTCRFRLRPGGANLWSIETIVGPSSVLGHPAPRDECSAGERVSYAGSCARIWHVHAWGSSGARAVGSGYRWPGWWEKIGLSWEISSRSSRVCPLSMDLRLHAGTVSCLPRSQNELPATVKPQVRGHKMPI